MMPSTWISRVRLPVCRLLAAAAFVSLATAAGGTRTVELLTDAALDAWRPPTGTWMIVGDASAAQQARGLLAVTPGTGTAVNGPDGRTVNLHTRIEHGDCEAHIEFMVPRGSNSGVYFQGRYEIQILDSWDRAKNAPKTDPQHSDCGGIYERWADNRGFEGHPPRVNACRPPGQWQTFQVTFKAPRFDAAGKKTANAVFVKVIHNGVVIHENQEVTGPTRAASFNDEQPLGPLMLQGDHGPVAYRNLWIRMPAADVERAADALLPPTALQAIGTYTAGASRKALAAFEEALRNAAPAVAPEVLGVVESHLIDVLAGTGTPYDARQFVCRMLQRIGTDRCVPVLAGFLSDAKLAHSARLVLQGLPSPAAGEALRAALGKLEGELRIGVIGAIAARGDAQAVPALASLLESRDVATAAAALNALGRIGGAEAAAALEKAGVARELRGLRTDALLACAETLIAGGDPARAAAVYRTLTGRFNEPPTRLAAYRGLAKAQGPEALPLVLDLLKDQEETLRRAAALMLNDIPGTEATEACVAALPSLPVDTQIVLLGVLAGRNDAAATPGVMAALESPDERVRVAAIDALTQLGGPAAVNALLAMAAGGGRAGNAAIDALIRMPGEAPGRILAGKAAGAETPETCALLVRLLVARREASAAPALLAAAGRHGDSALGAAALAGYIRLLAFAPEEQGDRLRRLFEEAMTLAHRDAERKLVLETAAARPGLWSLEFVEKYRTTPALKEAADAAYGRIFAEVKKMALLEDEVQLRAKDAKIHGGGAAYEGAADRDCIGVWQDTSTWVSWDILVRRPGTFAVEVSQSMADAGGSTYVIEVAGSALEGTVQRNGDWAQFVTVAPGSVTIEEAGSYRVAFKPVRKQGTYIINLRGIALRRETK